MALNAPEQQVMNGGGWRRLETTDVRPVQPQAAGTFSDFILTSSLLFYVLTKIKLLVKTQTGETGGSWFRWEDSSKALSGDPSMAIQSSS